jgi:hypothetical protein
MKPFVLVLLLTSTALLAGCVAGLGDQPPGMPSAPLPEIKSLPPAPGMVWVAGSWHWNDHDWVWLPGRWEMAPATIPPATATPL